MTLRNVSLLLCLTACSRAADPATIRATSEPADAAAAQVRPTDASAPGSQVLTASADGAAPSSRDAGATLPSRLFDLTKAKKWTDDIAITAMYEKCDVPAPPDESDGLSITPGSALTCAISWSQDCSNTDGCVSIREQCRLECVNTCRSADSTCTTTCSTCASSCASGDGDCRLRCAKDSGACRQKALTVRDKCSSATCAKKPCK